VLLIVEDRDEDIEVAEEVAGLGLILVRAGG
jgi:hypothetical protein